jgi:hypothetical protein
MGVDQPRQQRLSRAVDHLVKVCRIRLWQHRFRLADGGHHAVAHDDSVVRHDTCAVEDPRTPHRKRAVRSANRGVHSPSSMCR